MTALTPERLAEIRERSATVTELRRRNPGLEWSRADLDKYQQSQSYYATDVPVLLAEVLRMQRLHQGQAGHVVALRSEVERLRAGIESLLNDPAAHETYEGGAHACVDADDLNDLLNPPTDEQPCCRYCGEPGSDHPYPCC